MSLALHPPLPHQHPKFISVNSCDPPNVPAREAEPLLCRGRYNVCGGFDNLSWFHTPTRLKVDTVVTLTEPQSSAHHTAWRCQWARLRRLRLWVQLPPQKKPFLMLSSQNDLQRKALSPNGPDRSTRAWNFASAARKPRLLTLGVSCHLGVQGSVSRNTK